MTLRVFDVRVPLKTVRELKGGQTPDIDKLAPTVDWTTDADFGMAGTFVSHAIGNLRVPRDGTYAFRLISDDGSRLRVGDRQVIDHDGLHGAEPKDGTVDLAAGPHPLRIEHFEAGGDQRHTLTDCVPPVSTASRTSRGSTG